MHERINPKARKLNKNLLIYFTIVPFRSWGFSLKFGYCRLFSNVMLVANRLSFLEKTRNGSFRRFTYLKTFAFLANFDVILLTENT